jgi:hypothetical protein
VNLSSIFFSDNSNDVGLVRRALSDVELLENLLMRKIVIIFIYFGIGESGIFLCQRIQLLTEQEGAVQKLPLIQIVDREGLSWYHVF